MRVYSPHGPRQTAQFIDSVFDMCGRDLPKLILPSPVSHARDVLMGRHDLKAVHELMSDPPYELAMAQVAVAYALDCEDPGIASAAISIARMYWRSLCLSEKKIDLTSDESILLVNTLRPYSADRSPSAPPKTKWRPSELIAVIDYAFALPDPTSKEIKEAKAGVSELLGRCLRHWLMNLGIPKGSAIGYLLTLEAQMQVKNAIPIPTKRRFNDLSDLEGDPRRVVRNLIHVWEMTGDPRPAQVDVLRFCNGFEGRFEEKKDPRK